LIGNKKSIRLILAGGGVYFFDVPHYNEKYYKKRQQFEKQLSENMIQ